MKSDYFVVIVWLLLFCRVVELINYSNTTKNYIEAKQNLSVESKDESINDTITFEEYLEYIHPRIWTWILIVFHSIVFLIGLMGNFLVCVAVYRNHSMRTVTNYFIFNLAFADFMVILFCLPPSVIWDVTSTWWFGTAMCKIVLYMQSVSVTVSVLTLTFISIDRWYAICHPLKFKSTTSRAKTAIGIIWTIAMACEIPEPLYLIAIPYRENYLYLTQCQTTWSIQTDLVFALVRMIFFYIVPLVFMSIAYLRITRVLWKSGKVSHLAMGSRVDNGRYQISTFAMNTNISTEGHLRSRKKTAKMLVAVVVIFAICFFPVHLLSVLRLTVGMSNSDPNIAFSLISHWLCYANSAVNPLIYNFMSGKFRREFRRAFHKCLPKKSEYCGWCQSGITLYNKESGFGTGSQSKNDNSEMNKLNATNEKNRRFVRKNTKSSVLHVDETEN